MLELGAMTDRIERAFALVDQGAAMLQEDAGDENTRAAIGLLRQANGLLKEEHEAGSDNPLVAQAIAELEPILFKLGLAMDWNHRN